MTPTRIVVAANMRARLAWLGMEARELQAAMGWSQRTTYNKLHGVTAVSADELPRIADVLSTDPGSLYQVPNGWAEPPVPERLAGLLTWRFDQLDPLTWAFAEDDEFSPVSVG